MGGQEQTGGWRRALIQREPATTHQRQKELLSAESYFSTLVDP